jgi:hypothetical protein
MIKSSLSSIERRAWIIMEERARKGRPVAFWVAYSAACVESYNRKVRPEMTRKVRLF